MPCSVVNGILIFKSGYLPKVIGVSMQLAGLIVGILNSKRDGYHRCFSPFQTARSVR
jgi:hypothetical protein